MGRSGQKVASAFVEIGGDNSGALKAMNQVKGGMGDVKKEAGGLKSMASGMFVGMLGAQVATKALSALTGAITGSIAAASNLNETTTKTQVIFGEASKELIEMSKNMADMGLSQQAFLDASATFGVFGKSAGLAGEDLSGFSSEMAILAADMASFSNSTPEEAILAIGAALRGESEPIRRYGVLLDDASLRAKAFELGIISSTKNALTPQQRVLAAQKLILEQTSDAQGDFMRTSDGLANQQRILAAEVDNLKVALGDSLLPAAILVTAALVDLAQVLGGTYDEAKHAEDGLSFYDKRMNELGVSLQDTKRDLLEVGYAFYYIGQMVKGVGKGGAMDREVWIAQTSAVNRAAYSLNEYGLESNRANRYMGVLTAGVKGYTAAVMPARDYTDKWTTSVSENAEAFYDDFNAQQKAADAARDLEISTSALDTAYSDLQYTLSDPLAQAEADFLASQGDLETQMQDVNKQIEDATLAYGGQSTEVLELKGELDTLKAKYDENAEAHKKATASIILDMALQKIMTSDLSDSMKTGMLQGLKDVAAQWGFTDTASIDAAAAITAALADPTASVVDLTSAVYSVGEASGLTATNVAGDMGTMAQSPGMLAAQAIVQDIAAELAGMDGVHQVGINISVTGDQIPYIPSGYWQTGGTAIGFASGVSDYVVPAGHNKDDFMVGLSSGETLNVTPAGETSDKGGGGISIGAINITAGAGANGLQIYQQFKLALQNDMRAAARAGIPFVDK